MYDVGLSIVCWTWWITSILSKIYDIIDIFSDATAV